VFPFYFLFLHILILITLISGFFSQPLIAHFALLTYARWRHRSFAYEAVIRVELHCLWIVYVILGCENIPLHCVAVNSSPSQLVSRRVEIRARVKVRIRVKVRVMA